MQKGINKCGKTNSADYRAAQMALVLNGNQILHIVIQMASALQVLTDAILTGTQAHLENLVGEARTIGTIQEESSICPLEQKFLTQRRQQKQQLTSLVQLEQDTLPTESSDSFHRWPLLYGHLFLLMPLLHEQSIRLFS